MNVEKYIFAIHNERKVLINLINHNRRFANQHAKIMYDRISGIQAIARIDPELGEDYIRVHRALHNSKNIYYYSLWRYL
jgi:hypothetical protein